MAIDFSKRSPTIEIMDDLNCSGEVVNQTLRELDIINHWLGGNGITINAVKKILSKIGLDEISIVDIGCGSGEMLKLTSNYAKQEKKNVKLIGIDANPNIIQFARAHTFGTDNIELSAIDIFSEEFERLKVDVLLATLFLHHFDDDQLVKLFVQLKKQVTTCIIVNDLHRHPLAYYSFKLISVLFSRSAMVKYDGPISVLRAFKRRELEAILAKAEIKNYSLSWRWAFRWRLIIYP